jgi:DNA-binding MarR family transcriptional regulator
MHNSTDTDPPVNATTGLKDAGRSLEHLHGLVMGEVFQYLAGALHGGEMTFSQLNALYRLYRNGPQTIAAVAKGADLSPTAASRMVERLVQAGLVERREDQADRRQKRIEVTAQGVVRLRDMQATTLAAYDAILAPAPGPVLARLAGALAAFRPYLPSHPLLLDAEQA